MEGCVRILVRMCHLWKYRQSFTKFGTCTKSFWENCIVNVSVADSSKQGSKSTSSIKDEKFFDELSDYQLLLPFISNINPSLNKTNIEFYLYLFNGSLYVN